MARNLSQGSGNGRRLVINDAAFRLGLSEILCVSRLMNLLAQHESIGELDSQLGLCSMP